MKVRASKDPQEDRHSRGLRAAGRGTAAGQGKRTPRGQKPKETTEGYEAKGGGAG